MLKSCEVASPGASTPGRLSPPSVAVLGVAQVTVAAAEVAVVDGIGFLNALKNAGVPKVSVRAMARTYPVINGPC